MSSRKKNIKDSKEREAGEVLTLKDGTTFKVLPFIEHAKYMRKQLNLINHTDKDIDERIRKGWIQFNEFKPQLCAAGVSKKK